MSNWEVKFFNDKDEVVQTYVFEENPTDTQLQAFFAYLPAAVYYKESVRKIKGDTI
jgi:hypothetical protein